MLPGFDKRQGLHRGKPRHVKQSFRGKEKRRRKENKIGRMISECEKELKLQDEKLKTQRSSELKLKRPRKRHLGVGRWKERDRYKKKLRKDVSGKKSSKHGIVEYEKISEKYKKNKTDVEMPSDDNKKKMKERDKSCAEKNNRKKSFKMPSSPSQRKNARLITWQRNKHLFNNLRPSSWILVRPPKRGKAPRKRNRMLLYQIIQTLKIAQR